MALIDLDAFQFFVNMEYNDMHETPLGSHSIQADIDDPTTLKSRPQTHDVEPISFPLLPHQGITRKERDIIKLKAQFVADFGMPFGQDLVMKSVFMKPELERLILCLGLSNAFIFFLRRNAFLDFYF